MATAIPTFPDEETPLLSGQRVPTVKRITEPEPEPESESESETATLAGPSNQCSRTSSIKSKTKVKVQSDVTTKTPLPWAQFSIVIFLQLAEPLTSEVIYPVSSPAMFFPLWCLLTPAESV
jgi:hypothetical protein